MKVLGKVLIWVIILGLVVFGVYLILPEYPHNLMRSLVQPVIDTQAKVRIEQVQQLVNKELNANYKDILEGGTKTPCWVYDFDEITGAEAVTFYGTGATINIKDVEGVEDKFYTSSSVKFVFHITGNNVEKIEAQIDYKEQTEAVKDFILSEFYALRH